MILSGELGFSGKALLPQLEKLDIYAKLRFATELAFPGKARPEAKT